MNAFFSLIKYFIKLLIIIISCILILILIKTDVSRILDKNSSLAQDIKQNSILIRKGNINGVPIAIPKNYFYFPFAYRDKSIWEPTKPGDKKPEERTFEDGVSSFAIYVHWPDMQPVNAENTKSYWDSRSSDREHSWLLIGLDESLATNPRPPQTPENGLARNLKGIIKRLPENSVAPKYKKDDSDSKGAYYVLQGTDQVIGLQWAEPVGSGIEKFEIWNKLLYWQGNMDGIVTDLIRCYNGRLPNPVFYHKCIHRFEFPEWSSYVSLEYPRSWLPQWRELKEKARDLLLTFAVTPENTSK